MNFWTTVLHSSYLRCSCLINGLTKGKEYYRVPFSFMFRSKKKYQYFCPFLGGRAGGLGGASMNYVLRRLSLLPLIRPWKQFLLSLGSVDFWWDKRSLMNYLERELPLPDTVLIPGNTITSRNTRSQLYQLWPYLYVHSPANKTIIISVAPFFPSLTKFQNCSDKLVLVGFNMDDDKDLIKSETAVISMNELTNTNRQNLIDVNDIGTHTIWRHITEKFYFHCGCFEVKKWPYTAHRAVVRSVSSY